MKKLIALLTITIMLISCILLVSANESVSILINGEKVKFTDDSGYPYVDENNRTMVPLRVTMETAGFAVGYDGNKQTAIVITEHDRIEVPIGTDIIYNNNTKIINDTHAVVKNGRTYLPIRAVLESADFTVEWDGQLKTVNAYSFNYNNTDFSPYSTSSLSTLIENVLSGKVVYVNGQYYATPEYVKTLNTVKIHYSGDDLNKAILPMPSRYDLIDFDSSQIVETTTSDENWVSEDDIWKYYDGYHFDFIPSEDGFKYCFTKSSSLTGTVQDRIIIKGLTSEFVDKQNANEQVFDNITVKVENGTVYFKSSDLDKVFK